MTSIESSPEPRAGQAAPATSNPAQPQQADVPKTKKKMSLKLVGFVVLGALGGLAYYKFIGCRSGVCPITSNPYISTAYGAVIGYLLSGGWS